MSTLARVLSIAGLIAVGTVTYFYATTITEPDVYAHHGFEREALANPVRAGDIVAIWPDGQAFEPICDLNLDAAALHEERLANAYRNALREGVRDFRDAVAAWIGVIAPGAAQAEAAPDEQPEKVVFVGGLYSMREVDAAPGLTRACECRMAARLNRREPVCTVKQSLIESVAGPSGERVERTVAVTLARWSNYVPEEVFAACGVPFSDAAQRTMEQTCSTGSALPADVTMRSYMNLIRREPLPERAAAAPAL